MEWRVWSGVCGVGGVVCTWVCVEWCVWSGVCGVAYVVWWSEAKMCECVVCVVRVRKCVKKCGCVANVCVSYLWCDRVSASVFECFCDVRYLRSENM